MQKTHTHPILEFAVCIIIPHFIHYVNRFSFLLHKYLLDFLVIDISALISQSALIILNQNLELLYPQNAALLHREKFTCKIIFYMR